MADLKTLLKDWKGPTPEEQEEQQRFEREQALFRRKSALDALCLPITAADFERLLHSKLDETVKSLAAVKQWLTDDVPWLLLTGSTGRGKTLAAGYALLERGGAYVGARELERLSLANFGDEAERYTEIVGRRTLVVDDLGREREPGRMTAALLDLLDARRMRGQKTIAIANVAKPQFLATYSDERLLSRLLEPGVALWVADAGEDLRRRKA